VEATELFIAEIAEGKKLVLTPKQRGRHLYVTGSTGSGKSKFLEHLVRQDIEEWVIGDHSIFLLDWEGSIYSGLMRWLAGESHLDRPVIPIDLCREEWVAAYNLLRKRGPPPDIKFDFGKALDERAIILVSLAQTTTVSEENARAFATLMLKDLWTALRERREQRGEQSVPPCYVYLDEFQNFTSPAMAKEITEARRFGVHLCIANPYPSQILLEGAPYSERLYSEIMNTMNNKVVFNMQGGKRDLKELASWLFRGTFDPNKVKHQTKVRGVTGYQEETRTVSGRSSEYEQTKRGYRQVDGESETEMPVVVPVFGDQVGATQFEKIKDQQALAEQRLAMLRDREAILRFHEMKLPVAIRTPTLETNWPSDELVEEYRLAQLEHYGFALPFVEAAKRLAAQRVELLSEPKEEEPIDFALPALDESKVERGDDRSA
jgi:hypothetical protein